MGTCKDCRHWLGNTPFWWEMNYPNKPAPRLCDRIQMGTDAHVDEPCFIETDGDSPYLYTQPDFGCTLFERKKGA